MHLFKSDHIHNYCQYYICEDTADRCAICCPEEELHTWPVDLVELQTLLTEGILKHISVTLTALMVKEKSKGIDALSSWQLSINIF